MKERLFVLTESQLTELLADQMKLIALDRSGVDNWSWYGEEFESTMKDYYPGEDADEIEDWNFWDVANARVDAGEYRELINFEVEED